MASLCIKWMVYLKVQIVTGKSKVNKHCSVIDNCLNRKEVNIIMGQLYLINLEWSINQDLQTFSTILPKMLWLYPETFLLAPNICRCLVMIPNSNVATYALIVLLFINYISVILPILSSSHDTVFSGEFYWPKDINAGRNNTLWPYNT